MNDPVAEFVAEARRCCALIENEQRGAASAFEKECLVALLRLYEQILRLPSANPRDPELPERTRDLRQYRRADRYLRLTNQHCPIVGCKNGQVAGVEIARTGLVQLHRGAHLWE